MNYDISVFMKALTPICVPASKTAGFLSRLDTKMPCRSTCQIAPCDPQSSTWAYKDSLKEEENRKLQKMKEEQHQKNELLEFKQQQQEEERTKIHQAEHRRYKWLIK